MALNKVAQAILNLRYRGLHLFQWSETLPVVRAYAGMAHMSGGLLYAWFLKNLGTLYGCIKQLIMTVAIPRCTGSTY
jgi:hypothetical protein